MRTCLLAAALLLAAAAAPTPAAAAAAAEPGEGEAAVLTKLVATMGAFPELLASWDATVASNGSLCGWNSSFPPCSGALCGWPSSIQCDPASGAITDM